MTNHFLDLKSNGSDKVDPGDDQADFDDFQIPNGMEMDYEAADRFKQVAKSLGLTQDEAQKLVDLYVDQMKRLQDQSAQQNSNRQSQWQKQSRTDKELAGNGRFDRNLAIARKAVDRFGGPKLSTALTETGAGNHPEILRCFYRIGKALSEDGFIAPGGKRQKKSYAETFYPEFNP